jgi:putative transposase
MHDSLWGGKPFRVLNIVDDYNRQALWIEPDTSLPAKRVVRVLNQIKESRGVPAMIRVDNGPEPAFGRQAFQRQTRPVVP